MSQADERRQRDRYPAHHLKVLVRPLSEDMSDMEGWEMGLVDTVDFNRFGIALHTSQSFEVGEELAMVIQTDDDCTVEIDGIVCNRRHSELGYRFGIKFDNKISTETTSLTEELITMEQQAADQIH